jgi:hypothetical protein
MSRRKNGVKKLHIAKLNQLNTLWKKMKKAKTDEERKALETKRNQIKLTLRKR